jgi:hypothetical protein
MAKIIIKIKKNQVKTDMKIYLYSSNCFFRQKKKTLLGLEDDFEPLWNSREYGPFILPERSKLGLIPYIVSTGMAW